MIISDLFYRNQSIFVMFHRLKQETNVYKFASFILILGLSAGCSTVADTDMVTSSTSAEIGYPSQFIQKNAAETVKGSGKSVTKVASKTRPSRAPFICTPAGFGKTSKCFAR